MATASAGGGHEGDDLLETLGRQSSLEGGRMSGLTAWFFSRGHFDDGLGRLRRVCGGRQRGVGGVLGQLFFESMDALLQGGESLLQAHNNLVTLPTSRTDRFVHTRILGTKGANSCPRRRNRLNGYTVFSSDPRSTPRPRGGGASVAVLGTRQQLAERLRIAGGGALKQIGDFAGIVRHNSTHKPARGASKGSSLAGAAGLVESGVETATTPLRARQGRQ